jgi:hypothetical protein
MGWTCSIHGGEGGHSLCNIADIFVGPRVPIGSKELAANSTACTRIRKRVE